MERLDSRDTDSGLDDEAFVSAEYEPIIEDEEAMEKTAVSRAMEQLLADMDHRSESLSDSNEILKALTDDDLGDDDVFDNYRRQLSSKSSTGSRLNSEKSRKSRSSLDKGLRKKKKITKSSRSSSESNEKLKVDMLNSEGNDTVQSVLRSVQNMSDDTSSTNTSGQTTQEVLQSVNEIKDNDNGQDVEKCIRYLDDRFVTRKRGSHREGKRSEKSKSSVNRSSSSDSFTISTPSHSSKHTSSSSLSEETEFNKNNSASNNSDDDRPDSDLLRDYQLTLSHALGEEEDEIQDNVVLAEQEDLDETLNADDNLADVLSPSSQYLSPRSELGDITDKSEYISPRSDRYSSSTYATPDSSLNEPMEVDVKRQTGVEEDFVTPKKDSNLDNSVAKVTEPDVTKKRKSSSLFKSDKSKSVQTPKQKDKDKKKKPSISGKPPKVIRQASLESQDLLEPVPHSTKTIIRPLRNQSRERSTEPNPLEKDAWGDSSSCSSLNSVENSQKTWRPLPPVPLESETSPKQSRTVKQREGNRKLPDTSNLKPKSPPPVFQSNFMKKAFKGEAFDSKLCDKKGDVTVVTKVEKKPKEQLVVATQPKSIVSPRPLPAKPTESKNTPSVSSQSKETNKNLSDSKADHEKSKENSGGGKTKIFVDYSKIKDKDSGSDSENKKKRIPVASALKKSLRPSLSNNSTTSTEGNNPDDIPFADDSEEDIINEKFYTHATSIKPKINTEKPNGGVKKDVRKRILPTPPGAEPSVLEPDHIKDICKAELEKARAEARERARLKSDEELGIKDLGLTPAFKKYLRSRSYDNDGESSQTDRTSTLESDDTKTQKQRVSLNFTPGIPTSEGSPKHAKEKKKKKSRDGKSSLSCSEENLDMDDTRKKTKSIFSSILSGRTPKEKQKGMKEKDKSSSTDTLEEKVTKKKKTKTPKSDKKKDKKKRKSVAKSVDESILSENMKDLMIGSVFSQKTPRRLALRGRIGPPKASGNILFSLIYETWQKKHSGSKLARSPIYS